MNDRLKRIAKKHQSVRQDFLFLIEKLEKEPRHGTPLGNNLYKIRLKITSLSKGKSGGARVITYVKIESEIVFLVEVYLKSEFAAINEKAIINRLFSRGLL